MRTHPLSRDRLATAQRFVDRQGAGAIAATPAERRRFARAQAKLAGFIDPPVYTLDKHRSDSETDRYARAIAHYRRGDLAQAIPLIDGLIAEAPEDPFLYELKGQMLLENGRAKEAAAAYREAVRLRPDDPAILSPAAHAYMEAGEEGQTAVAMLQRVTLHEPRNAGAWRRLGIAYGKQGDVGNASVALAEAAILNGRKSDAVIQARRAQGLLPQGSAGWLKADDILRAADPERR